MQKSTLRILVTKTHTHTQIHLKNAVHLLMKDDTVFHMYVILMNKDLAQTCAWQRKPITECEEVKLFRVFTYLFAYQNDKLCLVNLKQIKVWAFNVSATRKYNMYMYA